jgi:UDP-N-acetyl-D-glucosamine dehydrogenase
MVNIDDGEQVCEQVCEQVGDHVSSIQGLIDRIDMRDYSVGVVGLGYVGLPLLLEFSREGFRVIGFDIDSKKISDLASGRSYIKHISSSDIDSLLSRNDLADLTVDFSRVCDCDAILICVPTPLSCHRDPDLSYVVGTAESIAPYLRVGHLIVLESTTYPGTTEEVLIPALEDGSGLKAGRDFLVAYSPEREDPNNRQYTTKSIPKVVGGLDARSLQVAQALYGTTICETVPVSSCRVAEATKLMENIFRCVNIALVNELKMVFHEMGIDIWEVVEAAKTKPFGYMPFYPGPGLGGHCIPIDPFYLTWKAKEYNQSTRFIELAGEINTVMPEYVVHRTILALNDHCLPLRGSRILLVGLSYKKNVDDDRESPTYALWSLLRDHGADVSYYDPHCSEIGSNRSHPDLCGIRSVSWCDIDRGSFDVALICTAHDDVDHDELARRLPLVVDTRNACSPLPSVVKA